ncbi:MAG: DUF1674 domain-containing protein [Pseudoxanthomonas sp.]
MIGQTTSVAAPTDTPAPETQQPVGKPVQKEPAVKEIGGRDGPEPTRYGDWEKNGRCIDF